MSRRAEITRDTAETQIRLALDLDGTGAGSAPRASASSITCSTCSPATGAWTSRSSVTGDLETGSHHTVEDTGLALGRALDEALGDRARITRYGHAVVPMDEARAMCAIDVSGRPLLVFEAELPPGGTGGMDHELVDEFFRALASTAKLTLHIEVQRGTNAHHMIEAAFKAFARALREAVSIDPTESGVPSRRGR